MGKSQPKLYRFYRSNLATVVWNPKEGKALARFVNGQFYTKDVEVARKLTEMGYPQVSLDASTPPNILFEKGEILEGNIPIMPKGMNEETVLAQQMAEAEQAKLAEQAKNINETEEMSPALLSLQMQEGSEEAETENPVSKPKPKKKATPKASGGSTRKKIKRRK